MRTAARAATVVAISVVACGGQVNGTGRAALERHDAGPSDSSTPIAENPKASGGTAGKSAQGTAPSRDSSIIDATPGPTEPCWFEPLTFWSRCGETWGEGGGETFATLAECSERCLAGPCSSIVDYTWIAPEIGCTVFDSGGCTPTTDVAFPEDAGREYRKVCGSSAPDAAVRMLVDTVGIVENPESGCRFVSIGDWAYCEHTVAFPEAASTGSTLDRCLRDCEGRNDCTAVIDYWPVPDGPTDFECALHLASCEAPTTTSPDAPRVLSRTYRKVCDRSN